MDNILEAIRGKDYDFFYKIYDNNGLIALTDTFSEFINKRSYFTIDENGVIKRKVMNFALPLLSALKDNPENTENVIRILVDKLCEPAEKIKLKKIDRMSNKPMVSLIKNYYKLLANSNDIFSVKYSKELMLRDKSQFLKLLFSYVLMEDISSQKQIMAYSLENFLAGDFGKDDLDKVLQVALLYISSKKSSFGCYENSSRSSITKKELAEKIIENISKLKSPEGLNLLIYIYILNKYDYKNEDKFIFMAEKYFNELLHLEGKPLSEEEEIILDVLLKKYR